MVMSLREPLILLAKANFFIASAASAAVISAFSVFGFPIDIPLVGFVFFSTLFTYNFQRLIGDLREDRRFFKVEWTTMVLGLIGLGIFAFQLKLLQLIVLAIAGLVSILYAYPIIPWKNRNISLRQIPYLKLWIIVSVWTVIGAVVPVMGKVSLEGITLFALQQALFITALTLPFDIRDMEVDGAEQRTVPQIFGKQKTVVLSLVLLPLSALAAFWLLYGDFIGLPTFAAHSVVLFFSGILVSRAHRPRSEIYYSLGLDGMIILQGVVFFFS